MCAGFYKNTENYIYIKPYDILPHFGECRPDIHLNMRYVTISNIRLSGNIYSAVKHLSFDSQLNMTRWNLYLTKCDVMCDDAHNC